MTVFQTLSTVRKYTLGVALLSLGLAGASPALAMSEAERCAWKADKVEARYSKCLARSETRLSNVLHGSTADEDEHCERQFKRSMDVLERRATFKDVGPECEARISEAGQNTAQAEALVAAGRDLGDYPDLSVDDLAGSLIGDYLDQSYDEGFDAGVASLTPECDLGEVDLLDFEVWRREEGYWVGEYSFYGADGDPNQSDSWPYRYDHYKGFIRIAIDGADLAQRNIFTYPPQDSSLCTGEEGDVKGDGACGVNGNENIWVANQTASNCEGSLDGPFATAFGVTDTYTTILGDDTVRYKVVYSENNPPPYDELFGGNIMQNQLTTLTPDGVRVRTAQGFNVATGLPSYASFYRETRVTEAEFWVALDAARAEYSIREEDECAWDGVTKGPSGTDCETHFAD